jgi:multiple sugar transport system permease protein
LTVLAEKGSAGTTGRRSQTPKKTKPTRDRYRRGDAIAAWTLLAPAIILFSVFIIVPTVSGIVLSFFDWHFLDTPQWSGLANFDKMFSDAVVWKSLGITFYFVILGVVPTVILGFLLAVLVNAKMPGVGALRVLYFIPVVLSVAVSGVLWNFIYDPRQGPIAQLFKMLGWGEFNVLQNQVFATPALVIMMIWLALPIVIILYLSGLQRVPEDIYAAAALDGAGPWRTLWSITWPNVVSTTFVVVVLEIIYFVGASLDVAKVMTNGDPLGATQGLALYAYKQAFTNFDAGYASALSVLQLVVIVAIVVVGRLIIRRFSR